MTKRDLVGDEQFQDLVVLFDSVGAAPTGQCSLSAFERLCAGDGSLPAQAGALVRAVYVVVGAGLMIRGLAFFTFTLDAEGRIRESFNIPLRYLVRAAGLRADLGIGPARVASRSQCPVPWFALKLWEPSTATDGGIARQIQRMVWRNRDQLRPVAREEVFSSSTSSDGEPVAGAAPARVADSAEAASSGSIAAAFGGPGPVDAQVVPQQLGQELFRQQQGYLKQMRKFREDIYQLKLALREQQERNRRLQDLLRGEI